MVVNVKRWLLTATRVNVWIFCQLGRKSGRCREVLHKSQCMDFLSAGTEKVVFVERFYTRVNVWIFLSAGTKKSGHCGEVALVER